MPNARNMDHRIRLGTYTSGSITSTYSIVNWTIQTDQKQNGVVVWPWLAPYQALPPEPARIAIVASGTARRDGYLSGVLPFDGWTFGQMAYVRSTFYASGADSALVSMMLYDADDVATYLNATLYRPVVNEQFSDYEPIAGGYQNIRWRYGFGTITA